DVAFGDQSLMPRSTQAQDPVMLKPLTERPTYGMGAIKGYAQGGLVSLNDGVFSGGVPPSSSGLTALAAPQPPQQQAQPQQQPQEEQLTPQQRFTKALMTTDVLSNPDKLSKIQAIAEMNGMGKALTPWLERAYAAKKSGMIDGAMQLMQGRVDDAIDSLRRGGVKLADRPEPADPNNPRLWKINIEGTGERTMDIGDLLQTTLDPEKFLKMDLEKNESQGKRNVSDSQVRENDARVRVSNAQVGKLGEETKSIRAERSAAGLAGGPPLAKLPAPVATAEWLVQKGVYPDHKSAFAAVKTLNDKSPEAQRQELIKARMQGGLTSLSDAAKEVDEFMTQEGSKEPGQGTPPPAKKVLIFGKDFK
ncbi:MAG TPA: hypothetical protein VIU43_07350, partial [Nitrosospira sp.]